MQDHQHATNLGLTFVSISLVHVAITPYILHEM